MNKPLLSICIPTYNRAQLLRFTLGLLVEQAAQFTELTEIVVSDNASTDDTNAVVREFQVHYPDLRLIYGCNSENIGAGRNILRATDDLATGEYGWVFGDDDGIRPGALQAILDVLRGHPTVDLLDLNYSGLDDGKDLIGRIESQPLRPSCHDDWTDKPFQTGQALFFSDPQYFTFISAKVFRLAKWRAIDKTRFVVSTDWSPERYYPQMFILTEAMRDSPAYRIGYPYVIMGGALSWREQYLRVVCFVYPRAIQSLTRLGYDGRQIHQVVCKLFRSQIERRVLEGILPEDKDEFAFWTKVFRQFWRYREPYVLATKLVLRNCWSFTRQIDQQFTGGLIRRLYRYVRGRSNRSNRGPQVKNKDGAF